MKTNSFFAKKISIYSILGFFTLIVTSCGSYQNSSYYDNDGVYGSNEKPKQKEEPKSNSGYYKEYFSNLNKDNEQVFTDIDKYSSYNDTIPNNINGTNNLYQDQSNYTGWGSNPDNVSVDVYENNLGWNNYGFYGNNWGYGAGYYGNYWGWNPWYGPSWGWGWNLWYGPSWYGNYGYGYYGNNWGWNYGHLGHNYAYSGGRRNNNLIGNGYGNYSGRRSSSVTGVPRKYNNSVSPRNSANYTIRNYNNRTNSSTRSYNPSSSSPRSYGGGGRSYGGGGGRSGGGGRR